MFLAQENTMWVEEKGQQCEFCNVLGSEDLYVAGCFKIECNGCYIHGIFVNWDTCAVLLNCEKDSIQNICYCSTQITSRRAGFSCTFPL